MAAPHPSVSGVTFKPIDRFPGYVFGSDGSCWSLWKRIFYNGGTRNEIGDDWHRVTPIKANLNYRCFAIRSDRDRWRKNYLAHRLILEAFVGECPPGMEGCHNDGDPTNNSVSNLRWDTPKRNSADKSRHGTQLRGSQVKVAKVNEDDVREMRRLSISGVGRKSIAKMFGMTPANVTRICHKRTWKHID